MMHIISTGLGDLKTKWYTKNVSVSGTVFQEFSCGMTPFLPNVSSNSDSKKDHTTWKAMKNWTGLSFFLVHHVV